MRFFDCRRAVSHGRRTRMLRAQTDLGRKGTACELTERLSRNRTIQTTDSTDTTNVKETAISVSVLFVKSVVE